MSSKDTEWLKGIVADRQSGETEDQYNQRMGIAYAIGTQRAKEEKAREKEEAKQSKIASRKTTILDNADTFLENVTADEPDTLTPRQRRLKRLAEQSNANNPDKVVPEETLPVPENDEQSTIDISDRASKVVSSVSSNVNPLIDKVGSLPTVGGIGLLVLILAILLFTVVQVNEQGDTRMKQLWYMLNGRATIKGRQTVASTTGALPQVIDTTGGVPIKPDGSCPPGYHGAMANGKLFCQPDNKSVLTPPATGSGGPDLSHNSADLGF